MPKLKWRNGFDYWKTSPPGYLILPPSPGLCKNFRLSYPISKRDLHKRSYHPTLDAAKAAAQQHYDHKDDPPKPTRAKTQPMPDTRQYLEALNEVTRP